MTLAGSAIQSASSAMNGVSSDIISFYHVGDLAVRVFWRGIDWLCLDVPLDFAS